MKESEYIDYILAVGLGILVIMVLNRVSKLFNVFDIGDIGDEDTGLNDNDVGAGGATITENKAKAIAENLYTAMYDFGTDEDSIYFNLKGLTPADFAKVFLAFGKRAYLGVGDGWIFGEKRDLIDWFAQELDDEMRKELEDLYGSPKLKIF